MQDAKGQEHQDIANHFAIDVLPKIGDTVKRSAKERNASSAVLVVSQRIPGASHQIKEDHKANQPCHIANEGTAPELL